MKKTTIKALSATLIYFAFSLYLYQPYFRNFERFDWLFVLNAPLAAVGCFILSRRWVGSFWGSFFAGAIYGFGPFMLGMAKFHPTGGFLAASVPWFFLPAAFWPRARLRWLTVPLCALPFLAILLFFQAANSARLFLIPTQVRLSLEDMAGLIVPLVMVKKEFSLVGFYHIPVAALMLGFIMLVKARRVGIMTIFCLGLVLAFSKSFLGVSPVIWLAMPALCCCVLIGEGTAGFISAGYADRKWILATGIVLLAIALVSLLLAVKYFGFFAGLANDYAKLLVEEAKMYIFGVITIGIIFFTVLSKSRLHWMRTLILCVAMAIDIFLGAAFIVDKVL